MEDIPRRCCLCLSCRTALFAGDDCDCGESDVACLDDLSHRARILDHIWGDSEHRVLDLQRRQRSRQKGTAISVGTLVAFLTGGQFLVGLSPAAAVFSLVGAFGAAGIVGRRAFQSSLTPVGANAVAGHRERTLRGEVLGEAELVAPATGEACVAYGIELRLVQGREETVMYRDAVTTGFALRLGNGERLEVEAGRVRFVGKAPEILDVDNLELAAYLDAIDPHQSDGDAFTPLPFHLVREELLLAGDEIEIAGAFDHVVGSAETGYRDRVPTHLVSRGIPELRVYR